ncbi:MAG: ribonuclease HII [Deltaproteobacteria bacterium]|nr:MAG: ribonuclease HII [Deltaproteobacteria bacterium]RPI53766.1 MAG: ribonuclease HII [Deltaproteobacteria bacterium]
MKTGDRDPGLDLLYFERILWDHDLDPVAGLDEVGRGCLAGPVVAAAVILSPDIHLPGVRDSKLLSSKQRKVLNRAIREKAWAFSVAQVESDEIDRINILKASLKAMAQAVDNLVLRPRALLVDGNQPIPHILPQKTLVKGDQRSLSVAAASIVAKVFRDSLMEEMHRNYPHYNFACNKGYATSEHLEAIKLYGCCPIHRKTFKGVREYTTISQEYD